nr:hypothetical protein [uncultured Oribacterium sp.]
MRKNVNKLATLALSGVMVMSMAMPAFAFSADELTVKFMKKVYVDGETLAPQTAFNFKIEPAAGGTTWTYETTLPSGVKSTDNVITKAGIQMLLLRLMRLSLQAQIMEPTSTL